MNEPTVITMLKSIDSGSLITKFTLIVSHLALNSRSGYNFLRGKWCASLVHKQRLLLKLKVVDLTFSYFLFDFDFVFIEPGLGLE